MNRIRVFTISFLALFQLTVAWAQTQVTVSGKVTDEGSKPLAGVAVYVEGTSSATFTEADGRYTITVSDNSTITYAMLGYLSKAEKVGNRRYINAVLIEDSAFAISDAVVTGYSTQDRRNVTGAISTVKLPEVRPAGATLDQLLTGMAAGVFVSTSSGGLGSANLLTIRGVSSIMGDNNPLYVIDGVPIYGPDRGANSISTTGGAIRAVAMGSMTTGGGSLASNSDMINQNFERNPLTSLNPEDIESIEILKDAYATAIYGSRGAAGVILITTKKGKREEAQITINHSTSFDTPMGKLPILNGDNYAMVYSMFYSGNTYKFNPGINTDWIDAVTRTAVSNNTSASVNGGTDKVNYFISIGYSNSQSYVINNDMQNYNARINITSQVNKVVTVGANMSLAKNVNNAMEASKVYNYALKKAPNTPVYKEDGKYFYGYSPYNSIGYLEAYNPVAMAYDDDSSLGNIRAVGNVYAEIKPLKWLSFKSEFGMDMDNSNTYTKKAELPVELAAIPNNHASETTAQNFRFVNNNTLNLNYEFGDRNFLQGVVGQSYETSQEYSCSVYGGDFFSPALVGVGSAQRRIVNYSGTSRWALLSAFARVNYTHHNKYLAGLTYRLDGSSRFNRNHRFLNTPSVSLGWRISEEPFIKDRYPWVEDLKLRGSIGWQSQDAYNSYYGAQATYVLNPIQYGGYTFLKMSQPGNVNLDWEKTITYDAGLDGTFKDRRVEFTLDYYYRKTIDMLFASDLPGYTGYTKQDQNIADMRNSGIEFRIVSQNIRRKDWGWMTTLNLARSTNKILKLNFSGDQLDQLNTTFKYYEVGYPAAQWYLHQWAGVDSETGDPLWKYNDGTISTTPPAADWSNSQNNKVVMGTALPTFYGGLSNLFTYKNLELSFMLTFSVGGRTINGTKADLMNYTSPNAFNLHQDILKMWQIQGQKTDVPKLRNKSIVGNYDYTTAVTTTRYLESSDYLRLKNIEFAWQMGQDLVKKIGFIRQLKLFLVATNIFTITPYTGLDPESSAFGSSAISSGYDYMTMPQSRSYQLGARIAF